MQQNPTPKNRIYELFPEQALVSIKAGAAAVCWAEKTARNMLSDGTFPIKTVRVGSKRLVVVDDLARYYAELVGLDSDTTAPAEPVTSDAAPRPRGRPRKRTQAQRDQLNAELDRAAEDIRQLKAARKVAEERGQQ